jgi:molybdopterin-guanine dinucleotide biosynthesis protein A
MFSISIQAGGQSSRMGADKAMALFNGEPLIERIFNRVSSLSDDIFITSNNLDAYTFLGLAVYPDVMPGYGALGGLISSFHYAKNDHVIVLACDMPFINSNLLAYEYNCLIEESFDVVIPRTKRGLEPMHAIYRIEKCLPASLEAIRSGKRRMISWFSSVRVKEITPAEISRFDPLGFTFLNVNTPDEFRFAEDLAKRIEN